MQGFKSFADRIVINFEHSVVGIVGPNGCGKSNISDAIRWVLGEQSVKSLRGEKMSDIIFSGAEKRKAQNMAEVTLVFDNSKRFLNSDLDEIEVTRKIYLNEQDAEYLINRNNVRLKDITDLILDSGLGKDSLSIISQGNINAFAEAKPYERRALFEEAAGVAKYKKRKVESLNRLERTKDQLNRTYDVLTELEKQVNPLKRQANKARIYNEKKKRLEEIEIAVLVSEIKQLSEDKENIEKELFDLSAKISIHETTIQVHENEIIDKKDESKEYENKANKLHERYVKILDEIQILNARKIEIEEKRKYAIEKGNDKEKIEHLSKMLEEAKFEYEDRKLRFDKTQSEIQMLNENLDKLIDVHTDLSMKKEELGILIRRIENRKELLSSLMKDPFKSQSHLGVKAVMDNKNSLYGILEVVGQALIAQKGYEEALKASLTNAAYHIVTTNENSAKNAIEFLKRNRSGRATFIPLSVLKEHYLSKEHEIIAKNTKGYLGVMSDFITCEEKFDLLAYSFLGNTIVCDNLDNATNLSSLLNRSYKIVTLDGDVINKGGTMTGGKLKDELSIVTAKAEYEKISLEYESNIAKLTLINNKFEEVLRNKTFTETKITEKRIAIAQLEQVVDAKRSKYEKLVSDLDLLKPNNKDSESENENFVDNLVINLNEAYSKRDEISLEIKSNQEMKKRLSSELERKELQLRQIRKELDIYQKQEKNIITTKAQVETKLDTHLERLASEYKMTFEYAVKNSSLEITEDAKDEVVKLRDEIANLGNVNMNAPSEFEEVNGRYEFLKKNYDDLVSSRDKILKAIDEMDKIMKTQFKDMFDKINKELINTFQALFGGGKAKLVLEEPDDILNTGIDIDVQPPGKQVKSIRLFSGGEKTLIAICVLFTILKVRPVPLVVFDEVEAALDQANVERFARYVKDFSKQTQFIIITHRPGTMAQADALYGVTMQHQGVSQMLKVQLVDAIEMSDQKEKEN